MIVPLMVPGGAIHSGNEGATHSWEKGEITVNGGAMGTTAQNTEIKVINPPLTAICEVFRF